MTKTNQAKEVRTELSLILEILYFNSDNPFFFLRRLAEKHDCCFGLTAKIISLDYLVTRRLTDSDGCDGEGWHGNGMGLPLQLGAGNAHRGYPNIVVIARFVTAKAW